MKNFWKKLSGAIWLQAIAVFCALFFVNIAASTSLERVDSGGGQLSGGAGRTESSDPLGLDDQSFNESGAFGDWDDFSDFYEDSQIVLPESSSSSESQEEDSESSSEPAPEPSSESSSEPAPEPSPEPFSEPSVTVAPSEPASEEVPSAPPAEPAPEPEPSDSPIDAPSYETEPPIPSQAADEPA